MIFDFFRQGMPQYTSESEDKPLGWSDDPNAARRQEILFEMHQGLICLQNSPDAKQTVVCAGDLILTKTRENVNEKKLTLLDRFDKANVGGYSASTSAHNSSSSQSELMLERPIKDMNKTRPRTARNMRDEEEKKGDSEFDLLNSSILMAEKDIVFDYSTRTNIFQLALTDFCPYFCSTADLNGKQLRNVKKREIMSPFNMHFNITNMIELVNQMPDQKPEKNLDHFIA